MTVTPKPLQLLDLFSGIGGFSLGLERSGGFRTVAFCETEPYCRKLLQRHWPGVPIYGDIADLTAARLAADGIAVDAICGGFPCQDISDAGARVGIDGPRSGLWREQARLVGELRPRFVIVENVAALLYRGLGDVLGDLAALGYNAEWHCIPASALGAPHRRDRVWIIAYPGCQRAGNGWRSERQKEIGDADGPRLQMAGAIQTGTNGHERGGALTTADWWAVESDVVRVVHGVPARVDRIKGLGNAVVPQIPEAIGRAILRSDPMLAVLEKKRAGPGETDP